MTLIAPGECAELSNSSIQAIGTEYKDTLSIYITAVIGSLSLSLQDGAGSLSGTFSPLVTGGISTAPTPVPSPSASGSCVDGEFIWDSSNNYRLVGNAETGLYAGYGLMNSIPMGWLGMGRADTLLGDDLVGLNFIGAQPAGHNPCGTASVPAFGLGFEAFGLTFNTRTSASTYSICDQSTMAQGSSNGSASFRTAGAGKIDVQGDNGSYEGHGILQKVGSRVFAFMVEAVPSSSPTPFPSPSSVYRVFISQ